ncbi:MULTISPECIES: hypothetical protein [unclassified Pseudoalteromonas]|uniref:hypothetical protein n=1 Tax=unclassified Pseudoalteromonas TaxID=194690 RepID=UPI00202B7BD3|nr:hypothetical protein [Pseudoalteromonas sp. SCSIO 43088]URQ88250.1 hypothetical protein J8Z28_20405 [Pseudoalteromonas sp. SCSIO 43088]
MARRAMGDQRQQWQAAMDAGLRGRAEYHAQQAAMYGREVKRLLDRCPTFIYS